MKEQPRGLRNCNPGNIRINPDKFQGEITPSRDTSFKQFKTMAYGYRAMIRILQNYSRRYNIRTLEGMIDRWAPESENNTQAYVQTVVKQSGIKPDQIVDVDNMDVMCALVAAMSFVENGKLANLPDVRAGWELL